MDPNRFAKRLTCVRVGLHVGQLFQRVPGGIGRVTELLCAELPRHADVVAFASTSRDSRRQFRARMGDTVDFRSLGSASPRWRYELWHRFRGGRIDLDVDVCHAPSLAVPPTTAPLVVTVNDVAFLRHPETSTPHGIRFHERGLAIARREAKAVIVPSEFTRSELLREGFDARRLHCVPLAVRVPQCRHRVERGSDPQDRGAPDPYLLAVGTIEPRKDHATLLAAFERARTRHPDLSLVVVGASGWLPPEARRALERPGVVALGAVSDARLDALYDRAAIVVNASIYEGFGLSVLEGLAHGRPVVATRIPPHVEIAAHAARFFAPGDVDALTAHIDEVLDDPDAGNELVRAGRERARRFDVASTIAAHVAVYELAASGD
jgi:glycosyltransferase involved in cell wall biosynthesis